MTALRGHIHGKGGWLQCKSGRYFLWGGGDKSWIQFLPGKGYHMIYKGNDVTFVQEPNGCSGK